MSHATELLEQAEDLVTGGNTRAAIDLLTEANRRSADPVVQRHLVQLRHDAWSEMDREGPHNWDRAIPDMFAGEDRIPEVEASEVTGEMIRSAQLHHGGLVVRNVLSPAWCERLREGIDRAWEAIAHYRETKEFDPEWFDPLDLDEYGLTMASRAWVLNSGTAYVPDSPRLLFELLEALDGAGIKAVMADYFDESLVEQGRFDYESGYSCARDLLALDPRPTAIFASNDPMAMGVLSAAHEIKLDVPGELSVAGFDDSPLARHAWPPLTTVRQPITDVARLATEVLMEQLQGRSEGDADHRLQAELVRRASTSARG